MGNKKNRQPNRRKAFMRKISMKGKATRERILLERRMLATPESSQSFKPLPTRTILLPECQEQCSSTSADPGQESSIKIEGASDSLLVNPDSNIAGSAQLELLPETSQVELVSGTRRKCVRSVKIANKVYCRLCLKSANRASLTPLSAVDFNYPGKSEAFKKKKLEKLQEIQRMFKLCLPFFDSLTFNPVLCNICQTRLKNAYDFINQCLETQQIITDYINASAITEEIVSLNDIVDSNFISSNKKAKKINDKAMNPAGTSFSYTRNRKLRIPAQDPPKYDQTNSHINQSVETQQIITDYKNASATTEKVVCLNGVIDSNFISSNRKSKKINYTAMNPIVASFSSRIKRNLKTYAKGPSKYDHTGGHNEVVSYSSSSVSSPKRSKLHNTYEETFKNSTMASAEEMIMKIETDENSFVSTADMKIELDYSDFPDLAEDELTDDERTNNAGNNGTVIENPVNISPQQSIFFEEMDPLEQIPDEPTT